MDWTSTLFALGGLVIGALTVFVAVRKMPGEIRGANAEAFNNLTEAIERLTENNRKLQGEMDDMKALMTGKIRFEAVIHVPTLSVSEISARLVEEAK